MDRPLLALTRAATAPGPPAQEGMRQLVQLRWLAVGGQLLTILFVAFGLGVPLPLAPMLGVVALLALANVGATLALTRHRVADGELLAALLVDMAALTAQLYFSGGSDNPFIAFYLLQLVLGAILLEVRSVWLLLAVAGLCYAGLSIVSVPLRYPSGLQPDLATLQRIAGWIDFALTGALLVLFVTRITRTLRARDQYLADLRQQAAEQDGIIRMGLFASGAAHELGTPLASLSVILSDWRRMPKLSGDPELAGELDEMRAEVQRCKDIVSTILHSAGEPRGEAMASVGVRALVDEVAGAWRPTHAGVPLAVACAVPAGTAVIGDPALRQALANLLDNAAAVSPGGVRLSAGREGDEVMLTVSDDGPGFPPAALATVGTLYQSSKGAGHGLGLFLATNVARQLGGRLEARNRADGGAAVSLILPVAPRSTP